MIMIMKVILIIVSLTPLFALAEVNSWECGEFEGAKIVAEDGTGLGVLGPQWETDSIFNDSSEYSSTWSNESIISKSW